MAYYTYPDIKSVLDANQFEVFKDLPKGIEFSVVGIDQSINSTGVSTMTFKTGSSTPLVCRHFFIPPEFKVSREFIECREYPKSIHESRGNTELEATRLENFRNISNVVVGIIGQTKALYGVGIEGLAYGTGKTGKSSNINDLAGLNTLIRDRVTTYLEANEIPKNYVTSLPPLSNKARFAHGHAKKPDMFAKFATEVLGRQAEEFNIHETKESYVFDVVDSYAIARNEFKEAFDKMFMPVIVEEPKPELPFIVKKRFKRHTFNFRLIIMNDTGEKKVLCTSGDMPLKFKKSQSMKSIYDETEKFVGNLIDKWGLEKTKEVLTKKTKNKALFETNTVTQ